MRKRRVLALLLALSLTVSGNSMTVLAAEQGIEPALTTQDEPTETASEEEELTEEAAGEESSAGEDKSEETGETGETDPGESKDESDTDESSEKEETEDPGQEEAAQDDSVSENDITADAEEKEDVEKEQRAEVRMMTFTDDAGLQITYDANAARSNADAAVITDGVLTKFSSDVKGVVDLREKTEITSIGEAFKSNENITYVMLPKTVTSMADGAFQGCVALKGISIPSRLTAVGNSVFSGCIALTQIALPNSVTEIGANAFKGDSKLFMVNMVSANYAKLTTIDSSAFEGCSKLEFFCSDEAYKLPDSVTTIGANAFKDCKKIEEVKMPDGITSLGEAAYKGCSGIREVTIAAGLEAVSQSAFANCTNLIKLTFSMRNPVSVTIASYAFENCKQLTNVELPQWVIEVRENAFNGCTGLQRVYIKNFLIKLKDGAFPDNDGLCIVGEKGSNASKYPKNGRPRFVAIDDAEGNETEYYTYTKKLTGLDLVAEDIKLIVSTETGTSPKDINEIVNSGGRGVKAGTKCYVIIDYGTWKERVKLVSLKCNGEDVKYEKGTYTFSMPIGGAAITAEFELASSNIKIEGSSETIEGRLSSESNYDYNAKAAKMKVGQSAKFYLVNTQGENEVRIPTSKITYKVTTGTGVVSVDKNGTIKALKKGDAIVAATVKTENDELVTKKVDIDVEDASINHISVLLADPSVSDVLTIEKDETGIKGVSVPTTSVAKGYTFGITASAFGTKEDDEEMAVSFTWSSSDAKVAKLKKTSTTTASSENEITIPKGADGEATITVAAVGADKKKVTKQFVVSVQSYEPRLTATKITVNPNQEAGATTIGLIEAYGQKIDENKNLTIEISDKNNGEPVSGIRFEFLRRTSSVLTYKVSAVSTVPEKTYNVKLKVQVGENSKSVFEPALTIVVKKSTPNPTVSFDKKTKINLFYANDKTEIQPIIGKLGDAEISEYSLEPLTESDHKNYEDDVKFTENFRIDPVSGTITQKAEQLLKNKSGKPVLTGYLVLKFKGYSSNLVKKYKITIPTQTVAPSYVLDRTTDTFGNRFEGSQEVFLKLLDKKTKQPIAWDEDYKVEVDTSSTTYMFTNPRVEEGEDGCTGIKVSILPIGSTGKLVMKVSNKNWAEGKEFKFTYNIKIDTKASKQSLKKATITLNATYPDSEASFELVSNHLDEKITGVQEFKAQSTDKTVEQYNKLAVTCEDGEGTIKLAAQGADIKTGNYKYVYTYMQEGKENKVTLTVKVTRTMPTVTLKGTNAFNLAAKNGDEYVEVSEMTMTVKNLPEYQKYVENSTPQPVQPGGGETSTGGGTEQGGNGSSGDNGDLTEPKTVSALAEPNQSVNPKFYRLDPSETFNSLRFITNGYKESIPRDYFDFEWIEDDEGAGGRLQISLLQQMPAKTYSLKMKPIYKNGENTIITKEVSINIKVYSGTISSVKLSAKGKINLLDRNGEITEKNAIRYTPTVANLKDTLKEVKLYETYPTLDDLTDDSKVSTLFRAEKTLDKKSFYIVPEDGVKLENNKSYTLYVWVEMENFKYIEALNHGLMCNTPIKVKTAQVLPKVKTDKTAVDLYLSNKDYEATFEVQKSDVKSIGAIKGIAFGEKDEKAESSFDITGFEPQENGSLLVHMKLKSGVSYGCNTTNKITMYIQFENQGTNTAGTPVTMNVKINK
ncbi:MAG: leucine-rich repeat protein [Lachnospiraceae bacterium]|nr:leucine-rich repeat protein [Lachnospiraceae bacterium]